MKQVISQRGFILHNHRSTMVSVNTSGRSKGIYTVIRSTTGRVEKLNGVEMATLVNDLTEEGFTLQFCFGVRVEARVRLTMTQLDASVSDGQVTAKIKGSIELFEGHTGFVVDHTVTESCLSDAKDSIYSWFNASFGGKPRLLTEDGEALDFGTTPKETKASTVVCPF